MGKDSLCRNVLTTKTKRQSLVGAVVTAVVIAIHAENFIIEDGVRLSKHKLSLTIESYERKHHCEL